MTLRTRCFRRVPYWLDEEIKRGFDGSILEVGEDVALAAAPMHVPGPRPIRDAYIAATANIRGCTVVTRNVEDFALLGVLVETPGEWPI